METNNFETMKEKTLITVSVPENFRVMNGFEYVKLRGLVKSGLVLIDGIVSGSGGDETSTLIWPILQVASDIFDQYPETLDILADIYTGRKKAMEIIETA